ncbi:MAG: FUSC family protein [Pseudomonas sp.]
MRARLKRSLTWHALAPAWGAAVVAVLGCGLPLLLGLLTNHSGFLWAAIGAFQAGLSNPLHRLGMLRMLLLIALGACSAGTGFWVATQPLASLLAFATLGYLLAWLQRYGNESGKLGIGLAVCLGLGQGLHGVGDLHNPYAVATLFALGGLWVMLLAFILRGMHGLRMWPALPRLKGLFRVLRRYAWRLPQQRWLLHASGCSVAAGLAGLVVSLAQLSHGYWLTLCVLTALQLDAQFSLRRVFERCFASLLAALLLGLLGHALQSPALLVATVLPLIFLSRAFLAHRYGLFVLQTTLCFVLLAESLSPDWQLAMLRLQNSVLGVGLVLLVAGGLALVQRWQRKPAPAL